MLLKFCISITIDLSIIKDVIAVQHSDWPRANAITPTAVGKVLFKNFDILCQTLGHRISGDLLIFCGRSQIRTPAVLFRCFNEFETRQQKIFWRKLESESGKSWHKNMPDSAFPRTLLTYIQYLPLFCGHGYLTLFMNIHAKLHPL